MTGLDVRGESRRQGISIVLSADNVEHRMGAHPAHFDRWRGEESYRIRAGNPCPFYGYSA